MTEPTELPGAMSIPGARLLKLKDVQHPLMGLAETPAEWTALFDSTSSFLTNFLSARDGLEVVARSVSWGLVSALMRHRFDILQVVLNQQPEALAGIEHRARKWKNGLGKKGDLMLSRSTIGKRTFVLAYHLSRDAFDAAEWQHRSRTIAHDSAGAILGASDCAVIVRFKKSREWTYDALSFHRLLQVTPRTPSVGTGSID